MPPSGRRNNTEPLAQGEAVRFHGIISSASPNSASAGVPVEASAMPGTLLISPSSGSPVMVVALQLPQPSMRCASVEARRRSLRTSSTGAQVANETRSLTAMWLFVARSSLSA